MSRAILARVEDSDLAGKEMHRDSEENKRLGIQIDPDKATDEEKLAEIRRLGPGRGASKVWGWFSGSLDEVVFANRELFEACLKADADLIKRPAFTELRAKFRAAVEGKVLGNLHANRQFVLDELARLGIKEGAAPPTAEEDAHLRETQLLAEQVQQAQEGMAKAFSIKVGYSWETTDGPGQSQKSEKSIQYFDPVWAPHMPGDGPDFADYAETKKHYEQLSFGVKAILAASPAVYALVGDVAGGPKPGDAAGKLAGAEGADARAQIKPALEALAGKIDEAVPLVGDEPRLPRFMPVHEQLMRHARVGGRDREGVHRGHDVETTRWTRCSRSLGLSALSARGFLFANFATGGMAVFIARGGRGRRERPRRPGSRSRTTTTRRRRARRGRATPSSTS